MRPRGSRLAPLAPAAVVLLAAALRFHALGRVFPIEDEYFQFFEALRPAGLGEFFRLIAQNPHHVLLDLLGAFLIGRAADSPFWLRLPAAILGILNVVQLYALAARFGRRREGLLAAFLLAVSLFHIDWSRRADFWVPAAALALLQAHLLLRLRDKPIGWPAYAAGGTIFAYTHPHAGVVAGLHALFLGAEKERRPALWKRFALAWSAAAACLAPWFLFSTKALLNVRLFRYDFSRNPGMLPLGTFLARVPLYLGMAPEAGLGQAWSLSAPAVLSLAYLAAFLASLAGPRRREDPLLRLSHVVVLAGIPAVVGLDALYRYYYAAHHLLWILPFYLYGAAAGLSAWLDRLPAARWKEVAVCGLVAAVALPAYAEATRFQIDEASRFSQIALDVRAHAAPGDTLAFGSDDLLMSFLYHFDRAAFRSSGTLTLAPGYLVFAAPPGGIRLGGGLLAKRAAADEPASAWRFSGTPDDLYVYPPLRSAAR